MTSKPGHLRELLLLPYWILLIGVFLGCAGAALLGVAALSQGEGAFGLRMLLPLGALIAGFLASRAASRSRARRGLDPLPFSPRRPTS
jgi:hypothetical protein